MDLFHHPSRIFDLSSLKRYCSGKPQIEKIAWFKNHLYYHKDAVLDSDNISLTLKEEPGEHINLINGIERKTTGGKLRISSSYAGCRITTLKTTRRDELLFRYPAGMTMMKDFPFQTAAFEQTPAITALLRKLEDTLDHLTEPGIADKLDILALELFAEARCPESKITTSDNRVRDLYNKIMTHPGEDFNIELLVQQKKMSRSTFYRQWQKYSDRSPYQLLLENRINTAKWMLRETDTPVKQIALLCGFRNNSVFSEAFRKETACSPVQYRKSGKKTLEKQPSAEPEPFE